MKRLFALSVVSLAAVAILGGLADIAHCQGGLTVIWPNGGEVLYIGLTYKLRWEDTRSPRPDSVIISVKSESEAGYRLAPTTVPNAEDGFYWWTVPHGENKDDCRFKVEDTPDWVNPLHDWSDDTFWIKYQESQPK